MKHSQLTVLFSAVLFLSQTDKMEVFKKMKAYVVKEIDEVKSCPVLLGVFRLEKDAEDFAAKRCLGNDPDNPALAYDIDCLSTLDDLAELPNEIVLVNQRWTDRSLGKIQTHGFLLTEEEAKEICDVKNAEDDVETVFEYEKCAVL
jgi:hypothetical protein